MDIKVVAKKPSRRPDPEDYEEEEEAARARRRAGRPAKESTTRYRWEMNEDELEDEDEEENEEEGEAKTNSRAHTDPFYPDFPALNRLPRRGRRGTANAAEIGITVEKDGTEGPPTIEQLRASGGWPIERVERESRVAPPGSNKVVTAADLVNEMMERRGGMERGGGGGAGQVDTPPAQAPVPESPTEGSR